MELSSSELSERSLSGSDSKMCDSCAIIAFKPPSASGESCSALIAANLLAVFGRRSIADYDWAADTNLSAVKYPPLRTNRKNSRRKPFTAFGIWNSARFLSRIASIAMNVRKVRLVGSALAEFGIDQ
jgi:hypothetical protein